MPTTTLLTIEVSDIQATVLRPRPSPYKGEYVALRIDEAAQGREMLRRILPHVAPAITHQLARHDRQFYLQMVRQGMSCEEDLRDLGNSPVS
jgi:hypothetical protein